MGKDTSKLDPLFYGQTMPKIYAFSIPEISEALKVGDTYRTVYQRLQEWENEFPSLKKEGDWPAQVDDNVFFRDYSVHQYLAKKGKTRIKKHEFPASLKGKFSNEFFSNTQVHEIEDALKDIQKSYDSGSDEYAFYDKNTKLPSTTVGNNTEDWKPRPNQDEVIQKFKTAVAKGRKNLLMYAVMRFGKSYTAMCCANELNNCKFVLIVCGKADVKSEWKNTIQKPIQFKDYLFLDSEMLKADPEAINKILNGSEEKKKVAVFLTLSDLAGDTAEAKSIKKHHNQIFKNKIDLLLIDESHFGARAERFGAAFNNDSISDDIKNLNADEKTTKDDNSESLDAALETIKNSKLKYRVKLHLSGTPYRILMSTEFKDIDIIARCTFADIVKASREWSLDPENIDKEDWENPYFGFPQMIRFAFKPNKSSVKKMEELRKRGYKYTLSSLFEPKSIKKDDEENYKKFINEAEVLELVESIDGSKEDDNVFEFLNYDKIKDGNMCRHIVMVLPYCASCDAMEELLKTNSDKFINLKSENYEIINISGVDSRRKYKNPDSIKSIIRDFEEKNKKTITLTVNRMLTGSTVKEWDTMIYFKNTKSPQEYDQAVFRLQNPFIEEEASKKDNQKILINKKPQTLLVDFDPDRLFELQQLKTLVTNSNDNMAGNRSLKERLEVECEISPIICINKDKLVQVEPNNIIEVLSNYSRDKGVSQEAENIPVDDALFNNKKVKAFIDLQGELHSKEGLRIKKDKDDGNGTDIDPGDDSGGSSSVGKGSGTSSANEVDKELLSFRRKFKMYYARILFFSFLTNNKVQSLDDIIDVINDGENKRIASNLEIRKPDLIAIRNSLYDLYLKQLDDKILNLNMLSNDTTLLPVERSKNALNKFDVMSPTEHITPSEVCQDMISLIDKTKLIEIVKKGGKILDVASKSGEFTLSLLSILINELEGCDYKDSFYSIPTSGHAYEFTRKIYNNLGLNINNISTFYSERMLGVGTSDNNVDYELLAKIISQNKIFNKIKLEDKPRGGIKMKFNVIVGNPPYQLEGGSGGNNDAAIFQHFVELSDVLKPMYSSFIIPSRWFAGGRENLLGDFRKHMLTSKHIKNLICYTDASEVFNGVDIKGGVCYFLKDSSYSGKCNYVLFRNGIDPIKCERNLDDFPILIREPQLSTIVKNVLSKIGKTERMVSEIVSNDTPFGISSNPKTSKKNPFSVSSTKGGTNSILLYHIENGKRKTEYCNPHEIKKNSHDISKYKVLIPGSYGAGETYPHQILSKPVLADKDSVCSQSYLYVPFDSKIECERFIKYLRTRFFRAMVLAMKITQSAPSKVYSFVPLFDFNNLSIINWDNDVEEIEKELYAKYGIGKDDVAYINSMIKVMDENSEE